MSYQPISAVERVSSIATLRTRTNNGAPVQTLGYYGAFSGGGSTYDPAPSDTTSADNGGSVIVASDGMRYKLRDQQTVSILQYGAQDGQNSQTAVQNCLTNHVVATIPYGTFLVDTLTLPSGHHLKHVELNSYIRRASSVTSATTPVISMPYGGAAYTGLNLYTTGVKTDNRAPDGVVQVGPPSMAASVRNIIGCRVDLVSIEGAVYLGQRSGNPDSALKMFGPQIGGLVNYYHEIGSIHVSNVNIGLDLVGYANGLKVGYILGSGIGNLHALGALTEARPADTTGGAYWDANWPTYQTYLASTTVADLRTRGYMIRILGALDNVISSGFLTGSENTCGIFVDAYDNRGVTGGSLHQPYANQITFAVEPGGSYARPYVIMSCGDVSSYRITDNANQPGYAAAGMLDKTDVQTLLHGTNARQEYRGFVNGQGIVKQGRHIALKPMVENTAYEVVSGYIPGAAGMRVLMEWSANLSAGLPFQGAGRVEIVLKSDGTNLTVSGKGAYDSGIVPVIKVTGANFSIGFKVGDNGTTTTNHAVYATVEVTKRPSDDVTFTATPTTIMTGATTIGNFLTPLTKTAAYSATANDEVILANATTAAFTVTLPWGPANPGLKLTIKKTDSTGNAVTVAAAGSQTIDGAGTFVLYPLRTPYSG